MSLPVILLLSSSAVGTSPAEYIRYDLEEAVQALSNESQTCRNEAGQMGRQLLALFGSGGSRAPQGQALKDAVQKSAEAAALSEKQCTLAFRRAIRSAWLNLEKLGGPAGPVTLPTPTNSSPQPTPGVVDPTCWNADDEGCLYVRNGKGPANQEAWKSLVAKVRSKKPSLFSMRDAIKERLSQGTYLTIKQLDALLAYFSGRPFMLLEIVEAAAPRVVDPQNAGRITTDFNSDFNKNKALGLLADQPPGKKLDRKYN